MTTKSWYGYFKEVMDTSGLPVPESLFTTSATALSTISSIERAIAMGGDLTIPELVGAGFLADELVALGGVLASAYVGACIGAAIAASASVGMDWASELASADIDYGDLDTAAFEEMGKANRSNDGGVVAEVTDDDGVVVEAPDGGAVPEAPNGELVAEAPGGGAVLEAPNGELVAEAPDGGAVPGVPENRAADGVNDVIG